MRPTCRRVLLHALQCTPLRKALVNSLPTASARRTRSLQSSIVAGAEPPQAPALSLCRALCFCKLCAGSQARRNGEVAAAEERRALLGSGDPLARLRERESRDGLLGSAAAATASLQRTRQLMTQARAWSFPNANSDLTCAAVLLDSAAAAPVSLQHMCWHTAQARACWCTGCVSSALESASGGLGSTAADVTSQQRLRTAVSCAARAALHELCNRLPHGRCWPAARTPRLDSAVLWVKLGATSNVCQVHLALATLVAGIGQATG